MGYFTGDFLLVQAFFPLKVASSSFRNPLKNNQLMNESTMVETPDLLKILSNRLFNSLKRIIFKISFHHLRGKKNQGFVVAKYLMKV